MPAAFLIVTLLGAALTLNAYRPLTRRGAASLVCFFAGWLVSELPLHTLFFQLLFAAVFVELGALRAWPGELALAVNLVSWAALVYLVIDARRTAAIVADAIAEGLGPDYVARIAPALRDRTDPHLTRKSLVVPFYRRHPLVERVRDVAYEPRHGRRGRLDIYRHRDTPRNAPVIVQVHGGAWVVGSKDEQGVPLMHHLAAQGWVCVAINYRLSPRATFPDHIVDVKRAIAWVKENIAQYGGDPDFVVITGGSAGGHLASLAALTPNEPEYQPGFESRDTRVRACVSFYGVYDFTDRKGLGRADARPLLERYVIKQPFDAAREVYERASPMSRIGPDAPPFFVIHGTNDTLVPVGEARLFVELLRAAGHAPVVYAELPGAQHAFEVFVSVRTAHVIRGVERFLAVVYSEHLARRPVAARA